MDLLGNQSTRGVYGGRCLHPGGSDGEESACNAGDSSLISGLGRSPGEEKGYPLQYSCLETSASYFPALVDEATGSCLRHSLSLLFSNQIETPQKPQTFSLAYLLRVDILTRATAVAPGSELWCEGHTQLEPVQPEPVWTRKSHTLGSEVEFCKGFRVEYQTVGKPNAKE